MPLGFGGNATCRKHDNCIMPGKIGRITDAGSQFDRVGGLEGREQKTDVAKEDASRWMPLNGTANPG